MSNRAESIRVMHPLFQVGEGGSTPASALTVRNLVYESCRKEHAVELVRAWHSRLPTCQKGPWIQAFRAHHNDTTYAVALWNNPSGRCLPQHWLELRRMACSADAPKCTASSFLAWMVRWLRKHKSEHEMLISYQDTAVHTGTIYKAAGWKPAWIKTLRYRERTSKRPGTDRMYRWNTNGQEADASVKIRWEYRISGSATY
jgi:hypothetical protein